ncbi:MAG: lysophospholipid acyltransferase family protein [Agarilytica sp.]
MSLRFLHPKYLVLIVVLAFFWLQAHLPYAWQIRLGKRFGLALGVVARKVKRVVRVNIELCYPALEQSQQRELIQNTMRELGVSIYETFIVWFRDHRKFLRGRYHVEGEEYLQDAVGQDRGIILLSSHYGSVDLNGALLAELDRGQRNFVGTFRQTDAFVNTFLNYSRGKFCSAMYAASDQRNIVRTLKDKHVLWYAPDIEVRNKNSAFVDFMGVPASTTLAISKLARLTNAIVLPVAHYRENDKPEYHVKIFPPLAPFPTEDAVADTRKVNEAIEKILAPHPERYWWAIKRFKRKVGRGKRSY